MKDQLGHASDTPSDRRRLNRRAPARGIAPRALEEDDAPILRRIVRWVDAVRKGRADRKTINYPAQFIEGGSVGPAPGASGVTCLPIRGG